MGELPTTLPILGIPAVPFSLDTFAIVAPYALALAFVGLLESLLTAQLIDDRTHTSSDKDRECRGQGIANVATGFLGSMAGCAMIGQSMINVTAGARTRLSTLSAGVALLVLILGLGDLVALIPRGALVAVMVIVAVATFDWSSLALGTLGRTPKTETLVTVMTVGVVVYTHNLAYGVLAGVFAAMVRFAGRAASRATMHSVLDPTGKVRSYVVSGEQFFASTKAGPRLRPRRPDARRRHRPHRGQAPGQLHRRDPRRRRRPLRRPRHPGPPHGPVRPQRPLHGRLTGQLVGAH